MTRTDATNTQGVVLDTRTVFSLTEFCQACGVERSLVVEMVDEGIIDPIGRHAELHFHGEALVRAKRALRLVHDLGVNWPGAALALDLLDQVEWLERRGVRRARRDTPVA